MPRYAYDHLTFLDNSFLIMEGPNSADAHRRHGDVRRRRR